MHRNISGLPSYSPDDSTSNPERNISSAASTRATAYSHTQSEADAGQAQRANKGKDGESCARCGFLVPSIHCGLEICEKTKWCESCSRIPSHLSGNILRECLNLRRSQNKDIDQIVIAWDANGIPKASAAD